MSFIYHSLITNLWGKQISILYKHLNILSFDVYLRSNLNENAGDIEVYNACVYSMYNFNMFTNMVNAFRYVVSGDLVYWESRALFKIFRKKKKIKKKF